MKDFGIEIYIKSKGTMLSIGNKNVQVNENKNRSNPQKSKPKLQTTEK